METLKLKETGILYNLYRLLYAKNILPDNTCSYRGRIIFSLLISLALFPLTLIRVIWRLILYVFPFAVPLNGFLGYFTTFLISVTPMVVGMGILNDLKEQIYPYLQDPNLFYGWLVGVAVILIMIICLGIIVGIFYIFKYAFLSIKSLFGDAIDNVPETSTTKVLYKSWKEKYCKKINWIK